MNAREAKRDCCLVVVGLIESYLGVGQPSSDHGCEAPRDCKECSRKVKAFKELMDEMDDRAQPPKPRKGSR